MREAFNVLGSEDLFVARQGARRVAAAVGFSRIAVEEIVIVASELASNILKYGVHGTLEIGALCHPEHGPGIELVARDSGPPFRDLAVALQDGCDDSGPIRIDRMAGRHGIGAGLGAVQRLTDELSHVQGPGGKELRAIRFLSRERRRALGGPRTP